MDIVDKFEEDIIKLIKSTDLSNEGKREVIRKSYYAIAEFRKQSNLNPRCTELQNKQKS